MSLPVLHTYRVLAVATQVEFSVKKTHVPKKCTKYDVQLATPIPHRLPPQPARCQRLHTTPRIPLSRVTQSGDVLRVHYVGKLPNGKVFASR